MDNATHDIGVLITIIIAICVSGCVAMFVIAGCDNYNPLNSVSMDSRSNSISEIADTLGGVLNPGTYYVTGDIIVPEDSTLIIHKAYIVMMGGYKWDIRGELQADSSWFTTYEDNARWGGLNFHPGSIGILKECRIYRGGYSAQIEENGGGIRASQCMLTLEGVTIAFCYGWNGGGLFCRDMDYISINRCNFWENQAWKWGGGMCLVRCNALIIDSCMIGKNAQLSHLPTWNGGGGIMLDDCDYALVSRCVIYDNFAEERGAGILNIHSEPIYMENCTIVRNTTNHCGWRGVGVYSVDSTRVVNCIIARNLRWGEEEQNIHGDMYVTYSNITDGLQLGTGNISADPLFVEPIFPGDYRLTADSPCIDTGNPFSPLDPDGTRADMGACYYHQYPCLYLVD